MSEVRSPEEMAVRDKLAKDKIKSLKERWRKAVMMMMMLMMLVVVLLLLVMVMVMTTW
jgi:predicted nucleic acid-binding Zn ribbon protein